MVCPISTRGRTTVPTFTIRRAKATPQPFSLALQTPRRNGRPPRDSAASFPVLDVPSARSNQLRDAGKGFVLLVG